MVFGLRKRRIKPSPLIVFPTRGEGFVSFPKTYDLAEVVGVSLPLAVRVECTLMAVFVSVLICVTVSAKWRYLVASTIFIVVGIRHELLVDEREHRGFHLSSRILLYVMRQRFLIAYTMCIERLLRLPYSIYTLGYPL